MLHAIIVQNQTLPAFHFLIKRYVKNAPTAALVPPIRKTSPTASGLLAFTIASARTTAVAVAAATSAAIDPFTTPAGTFGASGG